MSTASDSLDLIAAADRAVKAAEVGEVEAGNALRLAKLAVKHAKQKLAETIAAILDEKRQPRLPFDEAVSQAVTRIAATAPEPEPPQVTATTAPEPEPVAKSWRDMTLEAAGYMAGDDAFEEEVCAALVAADVRTCGQLADRLLKAETFGLRLAELQPVYAAVEMLSEDDPEPLDFDARFGPPAEEPVAQPAAAGVTLLADIAGFPDVVWDKLFASGVTSLLTLMERVEDASAGADLPLRNKLVAYLVKVGCRLKSAEKAADAVFDHGRPRVEPAKKSKGGKAGAK